MMTLLSRFANDTSTQLILDAMDGPYDVSREDEGVRGRFGRLREWSRRVGAGSMPLQMHIPCVDR
jgi:hypothetical protein